MADLTRRSDALRTLRRWPSPLGRMFGNLWEDFESELSPWIARGFAPAIDVRETGDTLTVTVELPGVTKDEIDVNIHNNVLTIEGEKRQEEVTDEENYHRVERRYGRFERSLQLPEYVDAETVDASFKDGVLTLTMTKKEEIRPKSIEVK